MILVVGGAAAGKRAYVESLGYTAAQMADSTDMPRVGDARDERRRLAAALADGRPVLLNLHELVFAHPSAFTETAAATESAAVTDSAAAAEPNEPAADLFAALLAKEVITCDEVGSGVIPATREERDAREATGRLACRLAAKAERVVRIIAGIPVVLKEA
ncbi:MAG: bifunctional adenosylcobinamide kinase/adenosylcobinamide-phosphate guanylyltransferase [Clostridiales Family XIII bacterium]|jgi:adenosylcobinamide kinase/adenosylcobinamide-phosphate guanylyltransferase|nr:bifunctional adenosylcobinamide kinase/adenosylcobinamide-phosphate guanylyltransferase [Clostridiales Family XIII bacterium]